MFYLSIEKTYEYNRPYKIYIKVSPWVKRVAKAIKTIGLSCLGMAILVMAYYALAVMMVDAGAK